MRLRVLALVGCLLTGCQASTAYDAPWVDPSGNQVGPELLRTVRGPGEHCGWESAVFLFIGRSGQVQGIPSDWNDQFIRDPDDLFAGKLAARFEVDVEPPADAEDTGYSSSSLDLWIAHSDTSAVFVRAGGTFERWPRVRGDDPILCV
jgi:hypothetical protein